MGGEGVFSAHSRARGCTRQSHTQAQAVAEAAVETTAPRRAAYFTMHLQDLRASQFERHMPEGFVSAGIASKPLQSTSDVGSKLHAELKAPKAHRTSTTEVAAVSAPVRSTPVWKERSLPQVSFTGRSGVSSVPHGVLSSTSWAQSLYSLQVSPICATDGDGVSVRVGDALLSIGSWACTQERGQGRGGGGGGGGTHRSEARVVVLQVEVARSQCKVRLAINRCLTGRAFRLRAGVPSFARFQLGFQRNGRCLCPARRVHDTSSRECISIASGASATRIRPSASPEATGVPPTITDARRALPAPAVVVIGAALSLALRIDKGEG